MVLRSIPSIFTVILIFLQTSLNMSQCYWTSDRMGQV